MGEVKISLITITFNSEKTLERTIKSIINQEYGNLEYIIVDGGSTDGTIEIIKKYENSVSKWISEPDEGISNAFNKGIQMATGEIVGIINSDDGLLPGALEAVADAYDEATDIYRGNVLLWKEDSDTKVIEVPSMHFTFSGLDHISHQSTFVARKAYERFGGYDEKCRYVMDYDLLLRFERSGAVFKHIDKTLAFYTLGGLTFTSWTKQRNEEVEYVIRKNGATELIVLRYKTIKTLMRWIKKVVPKELIMKIRHRKRKV